MIKPTVGRVVWFYPSEGDKKQYGDGPWASIVTKVHGDTCVNLAVFAPNGAHLYQTSVILYQGTGDRPNGSFCEWMPYQIGQAAKTEELEKKVAAK